MKKTYQIPAMIIAEIELQQMIAASQKITLSETEYDGEAAIQSRSHSSVWGDDEEEY